MAKQKKQIPVWETLGHKKPTSRREFLGYGLIPFAARMVLPSVAGSMAYPLQALAANCPSPATDLAPFITLNLAGGAGIGANLIPRDQGGQLLPSYSKMGMGTVPNLANELGVNSWYDKSGMLLGLRSVASPMALANTSIVALCVKIRDDFAENPLDISGLVSRAGLAGTKLPNLGRAATPTGLKQSFAVLPPPTPLVVNRFSDISSAIVNTGVLASQLNKNQQVKLAKLVANLSHSQAQRLATQNNSFKELVECAGIKNQELLAAGSATVDPLSNPQITQNWGMQKIVDQNAPDKDDQQRLKNQNILFGAMVYNGLLGQTGTVNLEMGGFDYHDNTRTTGDKKDFEAGEVIGRILNSAQILNKKVFLYITSDGSVVSEDSALEGAPWKSDRGTAGMALMLMFDPAGRPKTTGSQIGFFGKTQEVVTTTLIGNNPEFAAQGVFANYLAFNDKLNLFEGIVSQSPKPVLKTSQLDQLIRVG